MKKIIILLIILFDIFIMIYSKEIIKEFNLTINICLYSLMPSLFFQIFFSNILFNLELFKIIPNKICSLFNISKEEGSILLLSLFSGYPNNIRLLNNSNNEYLYYVSNYVNPLFIISTVGTIYLHNKKLSFIILLSHIFSNIIMLYIFRKKYTYNKYDITNKNNLYSNSLLVTIKSISIIFSNLLVISLMVTLIKLIFPNNLLKVFILGLIEFSKGTYEISLLNINMFIKGLIILIFITFGSISIHLQMISFNHKIKYIKFLIYRILNVFISIVIYLIILFLFYKI